MTALTVTWRQTVAATLAVVVALVGVVVLFSSDGLPAVNAAAGGATRWFVHRPTGAVVLVDGYGAKALARVPAESGDGDQISVAEGGAGAFLLNDTTAEVKPIETAELRLGAAVGLSALGGGRAVSQVGPTGLTVVNPDDGRASALPLVGEPLNFDVDLASAPVVAPDGVVWTIDGSVLRRTSSTSTSDVDLGLGAGATLSLVGAEPLVLDRANHRARLGDGSWQSLATDVDPSELVGQVSGPAGSCGWIGANDDLWCVATDGIAERATIGGLDLDGADSLAIAGDAGVVVRSAPSSLVRIDWRGQRLLGNRPMTVAPDAQLDVTATVDLVWVDDVGGDLVWAINPWEINAIEKNGAGTYEAGDDGTKIENGDVGDSTTPSVDDPNAGKVEQRDPDNNGVDDPPVAVDDPVTARSGSSVQVQVTANDFDPDGEAIAVSSVGQAGHGDVEIGTASIVVYTPDAGFVGQDRFDYTIIDGNGTEDSATVVVELFPASATNAAPVGTPDLAETGPETPVDVEVLLNDVDPERDILLIGSFTPPESDTVGEVTQTVGLSGLPALHFVPADRFEGTAIFSYRPVDVLGGQGEDVEVRVEVAAADDGNREPVARPDAVRARRNTLTHVPVLVNDIDPDGDDMTLSVVTPLPPGLDVRVQGAELELMARTGAADLLPFSYEVSDGRGGVARGSVLVDVINDADPNKPPVLSSDSDTVVVGSSVAVDVLANDSDPDGDRLVIVDVSQPADNLGQAVVVGDTVQFTPAPIGDRDDTNARFTYTVTDGFDHEVTADVNVSILSESVARPPYARDDSTSTFVNSPVTIDVLRNDGDTGGDRPSLVGNPGCPGGGRAVVTADDQVRFDPPTDQVGVFRCTYEVTNSQNLRANASIIISVRAPLLTNEPPITGDDILTVDIGTVGTKDLTDGDSDPDGPTSQLTVVSSTAPTLGTATRRGNTITFTAPDAVGVTTIRYQVADVAGGVSTGQLTVMIKEPANVAPIANADPRTVFGPGVPIVFDVLANDIDPDNTTGGLTLVSATKVSGDGKVESNGRLVTITPNPSFVGTIVASYTISDGAGLEASSQVVLNVLKPLNRPPVARDDSNEVANGGSITTPVLFNDSDPDGDPLSINLTSGSDSSVGSARVTNDGSIAFTALPGAAGTAVIGYQISDGEFTSDAALRITVLACAESVPVAGSATLTTGYQQPIGVNLATYGTNGTIVDVAGPPTYDGAVYTPPAGENGNVTISYAVVNACRQRANGTITIDVNQDPITRPLSASLGRGEVREVPVSDIASDAEALQIVSSTGAPSWVVTEPGRLVVQPPAGTPVGTVSWTTVVADPGGLTSSVPITVTVNNQLPVGAPDEVRVNPGTAVVASPLDNDSDPDAANDALALQSVPTTVAFPNGATGTLTIVGTRQISIDSPGARGTTSFTYTVRDADGGVSGPVTVTVIGPPLNTPPDAADQTLAAVATVPIDIALAATDADGDPLTIATLTDSSSVVSGQAGLSLTITAPTAGTFTVTYSVSDGTAQSRVATITINAVDPPAPTTVVLEVPADAPANGN